jgi:hypothetical protein
MPDRRPTTWIRALLLAACCAAVLGLAACGGDDGDSTSTEAASTTTTTSTEDSGTTTSIPDDAIDASALRDEFNRQLLTVLTTQQNLTDSQAQCAIDKLEQTVSDEDLKNAILEAAQTGQPPQDLIDAGFNAGKECAGQ